MSVRDSLTLDAPTPNVVAELPAAGLDELTAALDALAGPGLHGLSDRAVLDRTAVLVAARNRLDAELTRTVRHAESTQACERDALKSMRSWLIGHVRVAPAEASRI
ncbi:hypothetical protein ACI8AH_18605, partial [Modestobacter sp. SYSU DS0903]